MQGLGGQDEDRRGGFERGGWALALFDDEAETFLGEVFQRASTTLTDPQWADTTALSGDVAAAVGELKAKPGGILVTYPVVVGQGRGCSPIQARTRHSS